ncbi:hypothetical protein MASR1M36_03940 [Candidatus Cloacimonadaceae bacterium]
MFGKAIRYKQIITILTGFTLATQVSVAAVRKEFSELDKLYESGKLDDVSASLISLKPSSEDERAAVGFYTALLKTNSSEAIKVHQHIIEKFSATIYAQRSLLELGKQYLLERKVDEAKASFRQIVSPALVERYYWLSLCAWWQEDLDAAIAQAENYLRLEPKGDFAENAYYLMADSYLAQKKAYSAVSTLNKLLNLKLPDTDDQYLYYRLGYAYEQSEKIVDAVAAYRQGYEMDKYSQTAYLIEDRLFELRSRSRTVDISFLYPYSILQIALAEADSLSAPKQAGDVQNDLAASNSPPLPTPSVTNPVNPNSPVKLKTKPLEGYWLQAGRFSVEANANKLVVNIRLMNIPAVYYEDDTGGKKSWVVLCGAFPDKNQAETARQSLANEKINSFITFY